MSKQSLIGGMDILVDDQDYQRVCSEKWEIDLKAYVSTSMIYFKNKNNVQLLDFIMGLDKFSREFADYRNGNHLDATRGNIIVLPIHLSHRYPLSAEKSGFFGVSKNKKTGKWRAQVRVNGKSVYLAEFDNKLDAAHKVDEALFLTRGYSAALNFPDDPKITELREKMKLEKSAE